MSPKIQRNSTKLIWDLLETKLKKLKWTIHIISIDPPCKELHAYLQR